MALEDMTETGGLRTVLELEYVEDFNAKWRQYTPDEQAAINAEINARLDELVATPDARWGSITNTSIEGGRVNPFNGKRGDWTSYEYCERHSWAVRIYWRLVYYGGSFLLVMLSGMAIDGFLTFMDRLRDLLWM